MEIAALPQSLGGFLDSLIPALRQTILLILFVWYLVGGEALWRPIGLALDRAHAPDALANDAFIKESGVLKLFPIALLVATLLAMVSIDRLVSFIGSQIPGKLSYSEPNVLFRTVPEEQLAQFWSLYPAAKDAYTLHLVLDQQVTLVPFPEGRTARFPWESHDSKYSEANQYSNDLKFYLAFGFLLCCLKKRVVVGNRRVVARYLLFAAATAVVATYLVITQIESKRQSDWAKLNFMLASRIAADPRAEAVLNDDESQKRFRAKIDAYRSSDHGWSFFAAL